MQSLPTRHLGGRDIPSLPASRMYCFWNSTLSCSSMFCTSASVAEKSGFRLHIGSRWSWIIMNENIQKKKLCHKYKNRAQLLNGLTYVKTITFIKPLPLLFRGQYYDCVRYVDLSKLWDYLILLGVLEVFRFYATLIIFVDNNNNNHHHYKKHNGPQKLIWFFITFYDTTDAI